VITFARAVDDYLHAIVRIRPFDVAREETLLEAFGAWLDAQPDRERTLDEVGPDTLTAYAAATALPAADHAAVARAVDQLARWHARQDVRHPSRDHAHLAP